MTDMVQMVARAIGARAKKPGNNFELARAAIAAMREPTEEHIREAGDAYIIAALEASLTDSPALRPLYEFWRAMIDEALR